MELAESINSINNQLSDHFGKDVGTGKVIWRVVFSEDQFEQRMIDCTDTGILLTEPVMKLLPKYRQWIHEKYILERLVAVPEQNLSELTVKMSYEPIWTFEDKNGNYLPPRFDACKFIIDTVYAAQYGTHNLKKYHDPESNQENALEFKRKTVDGIVEELFGEQSSLQGTTYVTGESIIVPKNYEKSES